MPWLVQRHAKQPGSDGVVVEMVRALSWPTLLWLYLLFLVRLGWETERPEAWREVVLTAIPEKSGKVGFRAMIYTSVCCQCCKSSIFVPAVRRERKPHETNILGYEPGRSSAGVTSISRQVLNKAAEWGVGAFDGILHEDVKGPFAERCSSWCSLLASARIV